MVEEWKSLQIGTDSVPASAFFFLMLMMGLAGRPEDGHMDPYIFSAIDLCMLGACFFFAYYRVTTKPITSASGAWLLRSRPDFPDAASI